MINNNWLLKWQVFSGWLSYGMDLCILPRVSAIFGLSLTSFISVSSCHIRALPSLSTRGYLILAQEAALLSGIWEKSGSSQALFSMVTSASENSHRLAMPNTGWQGIHCHVFSPSCHFSPNYFFPILIGKESKSTAWADVQFRNQTSFSPSFRWLRFQWMIPFEPLPSLRLRWGLEAPLFISWGQSNYLSTQTVPST